jgi:hypothetical protein
VKPGRQQLKRNKRCARLVLVLVVIDWRGDDRCGLNPDAFLKADSARSYLSFVLETLEVTSPSETFQIRVSLRLGFPSSSFNGHFRPNAAKNWSFPLLDVAPVDGLEYCFVALLRIC